MSQTPMTDGMVYLESELHLDLDSTPWQPVPGMTGVYHKGAVLAADTDGELSQHLVKIDPGCCSNIGAHVGKWELHEIIDGSGKVAIAGEERPFSAGDRILISPGREHSIMAGDQGIVMVCTFTPALM